MHELRLVVLLGALGIGCSEEVPDLEQQDAEAPADEPDSGQDAGPSEAPVARFDAGSSPDRNRVMPGGICARFAAIQCAGESFCCPERARPAEACNTALAELCRETLHLDEIAAAEVANFDLATARTAFVELEQRTGLCDPSVAQWALSPDGFAGSIEGTLASGEECMPEGGLAAPLDQILIALLSCRAASRLACLPSESGWRCATPSSRMGRCFSDLNCAAGLYCANPSFGYEGQCMPRKPAGADCAAASECTSFLCIAGECAGEDDTEAAYCPA